MLKKILSVVCLVAALMALCLCASAEDGKPVAYYTFDLENLSDFSGNGYHGAAAGGKNLTFEKYDGRGYVLELNNKGLKRSQKASGFQIPVDGLVSAENFTLVMDAFVETDGGNQVWFDLSRGQSGTASHHYIIGMLALKDFGINSALGTAVLDTNDLSVRAYSGYTFDKAGEWAQLAYVNEGGVASVYLNGELVATADQVYSVADMLTVDGTVLTVGMASYWNDLSLDAKIDNVAVYDYALTAEQLASPVVPEDFDLGDVYFDGLGENGLVAEYFHLNSEDFSYGDLVSIYFDDNIDYDDMFEVTDTLAWLENYVITRWTGRFVAPEDGNYTFYVLSDNGVRLTLDGELLIDWWENKRDEEQISPAVYLKAGEAHDFVFEWFDSTGAQYVILSYGNDENVIKKPVPASAFYLPDDMEFPFVGELDTSAAQLDKNVADFGGTISASGMNLLSADKFELVRRNSDSFATPIFPEVITLTDTEITFKVPSDLEAGLYYLLPVYGKLRATSATGFTVIAEAGEQSRPERPDPSWTRENWINLNGWWDFAFDEEEIGLEEKWYDGNHEFEYKINVPYGWETESSGIAGLGYRGQAWYSRTIDITEDFLKEGSTLHLYFGAVDTKCIVYINGKEVGSHNGGYTAFEFDITDYVEVGENLLTVWVEDKVKSGDNSYPALIGKQGHDAACGYQHTSGIWQTVYLEQRSETYLNYAHANPSVKVRNGVKDSVQFDLSITSDSEKTLTVTYDFIGKLWDEKNGVDVENGSSFTATQTVEVSAGETVIEMPEIVIENAKLWSYTEANLYYGVITLTDADGNVLDKVNTYFGLREVYTDIYDGRDYEYVFLNGAPVFLSGVLDQGYWPDGNYTAPNEEALKFDIVEMQKRGFNMIRKHLKFEEPLQYYWCDKLGMLVMQDMPQASAVNVYVEGLEAAGRTVYEESLMDILERDYNKPCIFSIILFNENWGIDHAGVAASDGLTTNEWIAAMYYKVKAYKDIIVEDMSPLNKDHIQPTDLATYHAYRGSYGAAEYSYRYYAERAYDGSEWNFLEGFAHEKEPLLCSEYGGTDGDLKGTDLSLCFKYQTDIFRMIERYNGYVFTGPYDIEDEERYGILTYDRNAKAFPYEDIAYGGDMTMADFNQPNYVGIYDVPARHVDGGSSYSVDTVASNWSGTAYTDAVLKWRFDATDIYGNYFSTGIFGEKEIPYALYTAEHHKISFTVPDKTCVGTITVWIESNGEKLAKNFINIIVSSDDVNEVDYFDNDSVALRNIVETDKFENTGSITLDYELPEEFDISDLTSLRILAEVSSVKGARVVNNISYRVDAATHEGGELPSDMTVFVNGIEIDTVYLPDNPRDMRGTLTFNAVPQDDGSAAIAYDYGYLVNILIPSDKVEAVRDAIARDGKITVSYTVEEDAENPNGIRIYGHTDGRYALPPTVILNPVDGDVATGANYLATAVLSDGDTLTVRGGAMVASLTDGVLSFGGESVNIGDGEHTVSIRTFDDRYSVYADNDPAPVIEVYDYTAYSAYDVTTSGEDLNVAPETYPTFITFSVTEIGTAEELVALMNDPTAWSANYILTADIDLTGLAQTPIGNDTTPFTGTINGNGKTIKGISLSGAGNVGFFGVAGDCEITGLTLEGSVTSTADNAGGFIGKLVGKAVIDNCVSKVATDGTNNVGGFVGYASEGVDSALTVTNSLNEADTTGSGARVGGFVGFVKSTTAANSFVFDTCINKGNVSGAQMVGGFVGRFETGGGNAGAFHKFINSANYGNIETTSANYTGGIIGLFTYNSGGTSKYIFDNLYNQGNITSTARYNGGIVGYFRSYADRVGGFYNCMNKGSVYSSVTGNAYNGGIIGIGNDITEAVVYDVNNMYNAGSVSSAEGLLVGPIAGNYHRIAGTITPENCYYLDRGQNYSNTVNETKVTTDNYTNAETFAGFGADYWVFTQNGPKLKMFYEPADDVIPEVKSTEIGTVGEFVALMNNPSAWSGDYILTADIDLTGLAQTPIGNDATPFTGTINGNGKTIKGISLSGAGNIGFIGVAGNCTINNLTLEGSVTSTADNAGGFIGKLAGDVVIDNCVNKVVVGGTNNVGGFVGHAPAKVECSLAITNSANEATITGSSARVGGFVGYVSSTIASKNFVFDACVNKGNVTGAQLTGGIVGRFETGAGNTGAFHKFINSANYGNVETTSANYTGGIIGLFTFNSGDTSEYVFENLYNQGDITSKAKYNGGLVGYFRSYADDVGGFYNCMNKGTVYSSVTGGAYNGGIIGVGNDITSKVTYDMVNMYNAGSVSSADGLLVGPIAGTYHKVAGTITPENCYYLDIGETYSYTVNEIKVTTDNYASAEIFAGFGVDYWMFTQNGPELKTFHVHTEETIPAVAPTYTSTGLTEGKKCSVCGEILVAQEEIPMLEGGIPGDTNGDGIVSMTDLLSLIKSILNYTPVKNGDLNGDGIINLIDVIRVMRLIVK